MRLKAIVATALLASLLLSALSPVLAAFAAAPALPAARAPALAPSGIPPLVAPGGAWTLLGAQPPGRDAPCWAYDSRADRFILFGGGTSGSASTNSTWSYDYANNTWTDVTPVVGPSPRATASMAYDSRADRLVLFGGSPAFPASLNDTWIFDYRNRTWTNVTKSTAPPARAFGAMSYDPVADKAILFDGVGGPFGGTLLADTWAYDYGTDTWSLRNPTGSPSGRFGSSMAYDPVARASLEFGGVGAAGMSLMFFSDLYSYAYAANTWSLLQPPASPPGRSAGAMSYDVTAHRFILFGGTAGLSTSSYRNDTWAYDSTSNRWANLTPAQSPPARVDTVMDFDIRAGRTVLFGGSPGGSTPFDDVWSYEFGPALPSAPLNLAAVGGPSRVNLTWQAPASDGSSTITNYTIYRGTASGGETLLKTVGPVLAYSDTAVTSGTTYYYEVSATNAVGAGPKSNEAHATPTAPDTTPPKIAITAPANNSVVGLVNVTVTGTASDNVALQKVEVSTDGSTWSLATGTTSWSANVALTSGANTIYARATDTSGNKATARVTVTVQLPSGGGLFGSSTTLMIGLIVVVVAVLAAVALLLMRRRRRPQQPQSVPPEAIAVQTPPPPPPMPPASPPGRT